MPNTFAYIMLFGWPLVTLVMFASLRAERALLYSLIGGFLLLPMRVSVDLRGLPEFDKTTLPSLAALACALLVARDKPNLLPKSPTVLLLVGLALLGPFLTAMANTDALRVGIVFRPGLDLYEGLSTAFSRAVFFLVPFLLARHYLATPERHLLFLRVLLVAGLGYSLLMLYEVRMSPQLHNMVYGFFPHTWLQMIRFGGYRPIVFMPHGIEVAVFAVLVTLAAVALWRGATGEERTRLALAIPYMIVVVILCKTGSAYAVAAVALPVALVMGPRGYVIAAAGLAALTLIYPVMRSAGLVPIGALLDFVGQLSPARAATLGGRLGMEGLLLDRALERPLLGWGGWARNEVYDPQTGEDLSVIDGYWIITFGKWGWLGFLSTIGLTALPIFMILLRMRAAPSFATAGLCLILGVNLFDFLPNSSTWPITWMIAGALVGYAETLARDPAAEIRGRRALGRGGTRRGKAAPGPAPPPEEGAEAAAQGTPRPGRRRPGAVPPRRPPGRRLGAAPPRGRGRGG